MSQVKNQTGIAHLALVAAVVVVAVVAFAGYKVMKANQDNTTASQTPAVSTQTIKSINNKTDLQTAETQLNSSNVDSDLNPDSLNSDVSSLL